MHLLCTLCVKDGDFKMAESDFKIKVGVELDSNAATTLQNELDGIKKLEANVKAKFDDSQVKNAANNVDAPEIKVRGKFDAESMASDLSSALGTQAFRRANPIKIYVTPTFGPNALSSLQTELNKKEFTVKPILDKAAANSIIKSLNSLDGNDRTLNLIFNDSGAKEHLERIAELVKDIRGGDPALTVKANTKNATDELGKVERQLKNISDGTFEAQIFPDASGAVEVVKKHSKELTNAVLDTKEAIDSATRKSAKQLLEAEFQNVENQLTEFISNVNKRLAPLNTKLNNVSDKLANLGSADTASNIEAMKVPFDNVRSSISDVQSEINSIITLLDRVPGLANRARSAAAGVDSTVSTAGAKKGKDKTVTDSAKEAVAICEEAEKLIRIVIAQEDK